MTFTLATGMHERARPLAEGRARAEGLDLKTIMMKDNGGRHDRFLKGEFDAAEFSWGFYLRCWSQRMDFQAIPVFFNRQFRHSAIYVNANAGVREPRDLEGKAVGISSWFNTAALWARGVLQHEYGVDLTKIRWVTAEPEEVGTAELPPGVTMTAASGPQVKALIAGEIAGLITPRTPSRDHGPTVVRLFPNFQDVEAAYFKKTGAFPMSHALVVRNTFLNEDPTLAERLFRACDEALGLAFEYADDPEHSTLAWFGAEYEREQEILGPNPWSYGIEPNRKSLETLVTYGYTSRLLAEKVAVEELFHPSARHLTAARGKAEPAAARA